MLAVDVDSYPGDEAVRVNNRLIGNYDNVKFTVYQRSSANIVFYENRTFQFNFPSINYSAFNSIRPKRFFTGDFDGDGKDEILMVTRSEESTSNHQDGILTLIDPTQGIIKKSFSIDSCYWECPLVNDDSGNRQTLLNKSDRLLQIDIDGDGKQELAVITRHGMKIYRFGFDSAGDIDLNVIRANTNLAINPTNSFDFRVGDFNGDGKSDLLKYNIKNKNNNYLVSFNNYISNGSDSFYCGSLDSLIITEPNLRLILADVDRDGSTDLVFHLPTNSNHSEFIFNYKYNYHNSIVSSVESNGFLTVDANTLLIPANSAANNADGIGSLLTINGKGQIKLFSHTKPVNIGYTISSFDDGTGNIHRFTYARTYLHSGMAFETNKYTFPYASYASGKLVCIRHSHIHYNTLNYNTTEHDTISDIHYGYSYPAIHRQGLGFMGFEKVVSIDSISNLLTNRFYYPDSLGVCRREDARVGGSTLSILNHRHSISVDALKRIHINRTHTYAEDFATGNTSATDFTYDSYDNILTKSTAYSDGTSEVNQYQRYNIDNQSFYKIGLEHSSSTSVTLPGKSPYTKRRVTTYNANWLPATVSDYVNNEIQSASKKTFTYDNQRRVTEIANQTFNGPERKRYFSYSGNYYRPTSISDERGILTYITYGDFGITSTIQYPDPESHEDPEAPGVEDRGNRSSGEIGNNLPIEPDGITTRWHYDTMGRVDSITDPSGAGKRTLWSWAGTNDFGGNLLTETRSDAKPDTRQWTDPSGRVVRTATQHFDGRWVATEHRYDKRNRLIATSRPSRTTASLWDTYTYDVYNRLTAKQYCDGHADTYSYNQNTITSTIDGTTSSRTYNSLGMLAEVADPGGAIRYALRSDGQPDSVVANNNILTTFAYDSFHRRTAINDPAAGLRQTAYDNAGNIASQTDARPTSVSNTYNTLGKVTSRQLSGGQAGTFTYNIWGAPTSLTTNNGHTKSWTYDQLQRPITENIDGFRRTFTYDSLGRQASVSYSFNDTTICTERYYYSNGTLSAITVNNTDTIWALVKENTNGQPSRIRSRHITTNLSDYDTRLLHPTRRTSTHDTAGSVQQLSYQYNIQTGNLNIREDLINDTFESFTYDNLNRLTYDEFYQYTYDNKGNITARSDVGQFSYAQARPYAFNEIENPSTLIPAREQYISYNALQLPDTIAEGDTLATFTYHADGSRATMTLRRDSTRTETRHYYGDRLTTFERADSAGTQTKSVLLLGGTAYDAPAALVKDYGSDRWKLLHILRDNLGSITHLVDSAGNVVQELSYTPWGQLRDPETLRPYAPDSLPDLLLDRGFTGHEHLTEFGLINMNARVYDPAAGRFLNPDPVIQAPDNTQNLNRYTYCLNNPLRYTDESGMNYYVLDSDNWYYLNVGQSRDMGVYLPGVVVSASRHNQSRPFGVNEWMLQLTSNRYQPRFIPNPESQFDTPYDYNNYQGGSSNSGDRLYTTSNYNGGVNLSPILYASDVTFSLKSIRQFDSNIGFWEMSNGTRLSTKSLTNSVEYAAAYRFSRKLAMGANCVSFLNIINRWMSYSQMTEVGPNVKTYYKRKAIYGTIMDFVGFIPYPSCTAFSLTYGLAELMDDLILISTNGRYGLNYNIDTGDFQSIELTLRYYDDLNIYVY